MVVGEPRNKRHRWRKLYRISPSIIRERFAQRRRGIGRTSEIRAQESDINSSGGKPPRTAEPDEREAEVRRVVVPVRRSQVDREAVPGPAAQDLPILSARCRPL